MLPFRGLVEQLRRCIAEASQRRKASDDETSSGAACGPSHEWTCVELLRLLQQYPAGVTAAVMETELLSQWRSRVRLQQNEVAAPSHMCMLCILYGVFASRTHKCEGQSVI